MSAREAGRSLGLSESLSLAAISILNLCALFPSTSKAINRSALLSPLPLYMSISAPISTSSCSPTSSIQAIDTSPGSSPVFTNLPCTLVLF